VNAVKMLWRSLWKFDRSAGIAFGLGVVIYLLLLALANASSKGWLEVLPWLAPFSIFGIAAEFLPDFLVGFVISVAEGLLYLFLFNFFRFLFLDRRK
jgi:hypothetical protein